MPYSPRDIFYDVVTIRNPDGLLMPLADIRVSVYTVDNNGTQGALATIYGSRTGGATGNQFLTGADGAVKFWASPGDYNIVFEDTQTIPRIAANTIAWQAVSGKAEGILLSELPAAIQTLSVPGEIKIYGGDIAPAGYVLCDGSTYDGTVGGNYASLYDVIGTKFGGTGRTSFKVPDTRGRILVGKGTNVDVDTIGKSDSVLVGTRTPVHGHALNIAADSPTTNNAGAHTHTVAAHSHTVTSHTHTVTSHSHSIPDQPQHTHVLPSHSHALADPDGGTTNFYERIILIPSGPGALFHLENQMKDTGGLNETGVTTNGGGAHDHGGSTGSSAPTTSAATPGTSTASPATDSQGSHAHTVNAHSHSGSSVTAASPPYLVINHIIKL